LQSEVDVQPTKVGKHLVDIQVAMQRVRLSVYPRLIIAVDLDGQASCILGNWAIRLLDDEVGTIECVEISHGPCTALRRLEVDDEDYLLEHYLFRFRVTLATRQEHVE
jgi:hypothetical protein